MARTVPAVAGGSSRAGLYRFGHVYGAAKSGLPCRKRQIFAAMHKTNVGASLLAKAVGQSILCRLTLPLREQARSHREDFSLLLFSSARPTPRTGCAYPWRLSAC